MNDLKGFEAYNLDPAILQYLKQNGIDTPTPVQQQAIPVMMKGQDVMAEAETGTGKTLAFLLPIVQKAKPDQARVQALIVAPTRELALQITDEARKLAATRGISVLAVYGGQDVMKQIHKLSGRTPQLIIATPGRLNDHIRRGTINLSQIDTLVLDEADQMLHMGFLPEVEEIMEQLPYKRQTLMLSATMADSVRRLGNRYLKDPANVRIESRKVMVDHIKQMIIETTDRAKQDDLFQQLDEQNPFQAVIFCRTKRRASALNEALLEAGYNSDELHGDLSQLKREQVMKRFRDTKLQFLIATDVAARGLDVEGVTHVFNYDIPQDAESYVHRIGRTGRAGAKGVAITFVTAKDRPYLLQIQRVPGFRIDNALGAGKSKGGKSDRYKESASSGKRTARRGAGRNESGAERKFSSRGEDAGRKRSGRGTGAAGHAERSGSRTESASREERFGRGGASARGEKRTSSRGEASRGEKRNIRGGQADSGFGNRGRSGKPAQADNRASGRSNDSGRRGGGRASGGAGASHQGQGGKQRSGGAGRSGGRGRR
ncbi:DEAD/DEAH box helicase [Paenibacillus sp. SC116]|uniref:DEAD/DEAH box helicase n=1 Tax=Paenibacillus sp. SC116 TaxID=2968986 RepID=UPI00215A4BC3|nr:DEAD/DEAH box helicase [Paenibacillus sp. SC116]MCR8844196.1 DEAD/DEAH box helicase [Paenibacillus sp. SC116]